MSNKTTRTVSGYEITEEGMDGDVAITVNRTASALGSTVTISNYMVIDWIKKFEQEVAKLGQLPDLSWIDSPERHADYVKKFMQFSKLVPTKRNKYKCDTAAANAAIDTKKGTIDGNPLLVLVKGPQDYENFTQFYKNTYEASAKVDPATVFSTTGDDVSQIFTYVEFILNDDIFFRNAYKAFVESPAFRALPETHLLKVLTATTSDEGVGQLRGAFDTSDLEATAASFEFITAALNRITIPDKIQAHRMNFSVNTFKRLLINFFVSWYCEFTAQIDGTPYIDSNELSLLQPLDFSVVFPYFNRLVLSARPKMVFTTQRLNATNNRTARIGLALHCTTGPALEYADGSKYYFINGVEVPRELVAKPAKDFTATEINQLFNIRGEAPFTKIEFSSNVEYRREFIRYIGITKVLEALKAKVIHKVESRGYELLALDLTAGMADRNRERSADVSQSRYLKMTNPSTGDIHVEGVDNSCSTVRDAIIYRNNLNAYTLVDNETEDTAKKDPNYPKAKHYFQQGDVVMLPQGENIIFLYPKVIT